jgi:hypothetical protein
MLEMEATEPPKFVRITNLAKEGEGVSPLNRDNFISNRFRKNHLARYQSRKFVILKG